MARVKSGRTISQLKDQRKEDNLSHYLTHFTAPELTFYKRKLPKFSDDEKWKSVRREYICEVNEFSNPIPEEDIAEISAKSTYITQDMITEARLQKLLKMKNNCSKISKLGAFQFKANSTYENFSQLMADGEIEESFNPNGAHSLKRLKSKFEQNTQDATTLFDQFRRRNKFECNAKIIKPLKIITGAFTGI
eukprot:TRINITY_DN2674_c0_g2_i10.p1 TRINITY_DN2674_c0_g2~~TRINITY_DN2674_c0_g2_i10.p1  ORF type:complete len:192 (+),score=29.80 TRINITY_DN2674_c0_g2_i10:262-837(+)